MIERVEAAAEVIRQVDYPNYLPDLQLARRVLGAADHAMFSDASIDRAVPYVDSFLRRRGYEPRGDESRVLIGYVMEALKGDGHE